LATGEEVSAIPSVVIGATWHETAYKVRPIVTVTGTPEVSSDLLSLEFKIERSSQTEARILILGLGDAIPVVFRIAGSPFFEIDSPREFSVATRTHSGTLCAYLNGFGFHLYLADFSRLYRNQLFRSNLNLEHLPATVFHRRDWQALGLDIRLEFGASTHGVSIHDGIQNILLRSDSVVVVYDHRAGEIADFVALREDDGLVLCEVFHCKGSRGATAASRVDDAYEVAGQVVKSVKLARSPSTLKTELIRRLATGSILRKGTLGELERLLDDAERTRFEFRVRLVQPGISVNALTDQVSRVLAAAYDYVLAATGLAPTFWVSD
jgi:hypothetical protein